MSSPRMSLKGVRPQLRVEMHWWADFFKWNPYEFPSNRSSLRSSRNLLPFWHPFLPHQWQDKLMMHASDCWNGHKHIAVYFGEWRTRNQYSSHFSTQCFYPDSRPLPAFLWQIKSPAVWSTRLADARMRPSREYKLHTRQVFHFVSSSTKIGWHIPLHLFWSR